MSEETELSATATLTFVPNGVMITVEHPERGSTPARTTIRVHNKEQTLIEAVTQLFEEYVPYPAT